MPLKVASYTVHADAQQSVRWNRAAEGEGFTSTGSWLAAAADAYLKARARAGMPIPLAWRKGAFRVRLSSGQEATVRGKLSLPFGVYWGTEDGPENGRRELYTLVYVPAGRVLATCRTSARCRSLAAELARLWVRGDGSEPSGNPVPVIPTHSV